jgi:hypothetical protein
MEMEEYQEGHENGNKMRAGLNGVNRWVAIAAIAMLAIAAVAVGYGYRQQVLVGHLTAQESVANATISDMQGQLSAVTSKLNEMTAAQAAAEAAKAQQQAQKASQAQKKGSGQGGPKRSAAVDKRYKQLQAELEQQQKQLKDTQELVAKNRADLEGNITSTRDELNGSIAKTHEELVTLAKRGERSYFEFDLNKSKQFQRVGPVTLSLRKTDTKHKSYDLQMIVDDNQLTKKRVNLYEPIWIHTENESQPVQVVVNHIDKNLVHGYVSAPKFKPSELATIGGGTLTPVSTHPPASGQTPPPSPDQPQE